MELTRGRTDISSAAEVFRSERVHVPSHVRESVNGFWRHAEEALPPMWCQVTLTELGIGPDGSVKVILRYEGRQPNRDKFALFASRPLVDVVDDARSASQSITDQARRSAAKFLSERWPGV